MQQSQRSGVAVWTGDVVRPVIVSTIGLAVLAWATALEGRNGASIAPGLLVVVMGAVLARQVYLSVSRLHRQSDRLRRTAAEAERHYVTVLRRMVRCAEARDATKVGRSRRVGRLCEQIASEMGLPSAVCHQLELAGQLHDIGMLAVPDHILRDAAPLGAADGQIVHRHTQVGAEVLEPLESLRAIVLPAIRHHHERMNGTGYPDGLTAADIPLSARILAVAETYDAMTHDRPYRPALTPLQAMQELRRCAPMGYDPDCVAALGKVINLEALEAASRRESTGEA